MKKMARYIYENVLPWLAVLATAFAAVVALWLIMWLCYDAGFEM